MKSARKLLQTLRKQKLDAVVAKALASPSADLKSDLEEIDRYSKLLALLEPRWTPDFGIAAVVAILCITLAAFLWSEPVRRTNVSLAVETQSVRAVFARDWEFEPSFRSSAMHFERLSTIDAPNLDLALVTNPGDAWLKLDGGQIELQSLQVRQNASWEAVSDSDQLSLFLGAQPVEGRITVRGKVSVTAGPADGRKTLEKQFDLPIPETITFTAKDPRGVPAQLTVHSPRDWSLGKLPVSALSFSSERAGGPGDRTLTSGVRSGTVQFSDAPWPPIQLFENELLSVNQTGKARVELRGKEGAMHVTLSGPVRNVTLGDEQAERVLAPSYLEYFYNQKSFAFFWSAVIFLWGVIWSVRKTVLR